MRIPRFQDCQQRQRSTPFHHARLAVACILATQLISSSTIAQAPLAAPQNLANPPAGVGNVANAQNGQNGATFDTSFGPQLGEGGSNNADFESLIDLIVSTVAPDTWAENGGGLGEARPFPTGVMVDTAGMLTLVKSTAPATDLAELRGGAATGLPRTAEAQETPRDPRQESLLRLVSLPRLEREIIRRQEVHEPFDAPMLTLAGLQRIEYIFVYPRSNDLVLAGPAGDWLADASGRIVAVETGQPVVRLDDLLVLLRRAQQAPESFFGCMINPRQEALAKTQEYLDRTGRRPLERSRRDEWLATIRRTLGRQDIEIFGIDPTTRVARVLVEADVHMKLVGMGLEEGVQGVESYLDSVAAAGGQATAMSVLRWWFALKYAEIRISPDGDAYQLVGQGVGVASENEILAAQGRRVHTGQSDPLNKQFAESFTVHFAELAEKYPVYGELRTIFDMSLAIALMHSDGLAQRAGWQPTRLVDAEKLRLPAWPAPREVETVANLVEVNRRQIVAGVSGGVMIDTANVLAKSRRNSTAGELTKTRPAPPPIAANDDLAITWWWDAPPSD